MPEHVIKSKGGGWSIEGRKKNLRNLKFVTDKKETHEKREVMILKSKLVFWNLNLAQFIADPDKRDGYLIQNCSCEDCILLKKRLIKAQLSQSIVVIYIAVYGSE